MLLLYDAAPLRLSSAVLEGVDPTALAQAEHPAKGDARVGAVEPLELREPFEGPGCPPP